MTSMKFNKALALTALVALTAVSCTKKEEAAPEATPGTETAPVDAGAPATPEATDATTTTTMPN